MTAVDRVVVVGGGLAATRAVSAIRRAGYPGAITVVGAERHTPYDRPPLSKAVLSGTLDRTPLRFDAAALGVGLRLATTATGVDTGRRILHTTDGQIDYDRLVIATGATPVRLPGAQSQITLRTIDDAIALRGRLTPGARVVVIGASWIGAEVATAAVARGCRVTCVEAGPAPLAHALGPELGATTTDWWSGVDLRLGVLVEAVLDDCVVLADGTEIQADTVVVGIGVRPETAWLDGSDVAVDRGVLVDEHLRTSDPNVLAVGDVAARWSPRWDVRLRVEHWEDAAAAGAVAGRVAIADEDADLPVHDPVPYFWSDQFGHKVQMVGHPGAGQQRTELTPEAPGRTVAWVDGSGQTVAVLTIDRPHDAAAARGVVDRCAPPDTVTWGRAARREPTTRT
ncbi:MAG: hypothetical protein ABS81_02915 [Pseudonocardia sp. SCN 72-86]|nr:MAG: hypothetical protein ABS81_02915 [Pseudonocardia sp. SCN 72-86]